MLKVTSISSRLSHHSRLSLASISQDFLEAMDNEKLEASVEQQTTIVNSIPAKMASNTSENSATDERPSKKMKLDQPVQTGAPATLSSSSAPVQTGASSGNPVIASGIAGKTDAARHAEAVESSLVTSSDNSHTSGSNTSLQDNHPLSAAPTQSSVPNPTTAAAPVATVPPPPAKATTMRHLKLKYLDELEYMLREFRKLERQLLGAKGAAKLEESAGSRERREKLHSFILHLEETVQQIEEGCVLEVEKEASGATAQRDEATVAEDEDNVQRLEEHILANLLPVKIRLKRQLAAQQGATKNPPGMPAPRRGSLQPTNLGKGTFVAAAEERRKQAEAARLAAEEKERAAMRRVSDPSQFGKPLGGGGSSLTQKLHGATLGSKGRIHGHGVGSSASGPVAPDVSTPQGPKILYAGMVPQSTQHKSSLNAASGVHELVVQDPHFARSKPEIGKPYSKPVAVPIAAATCAATQPAPQNAQVDAAPTNVTTPALRTESPQNSNVPALEPETLTEKFAKPHEDLNISEEERRRLRKKRRKRKLMRLARRRERERQRHIAAQQAQVAQGVKTIGGRKKSLGCKPPGKKGPKTVEYMCALCSETYTSTCDYNPWWALAQHECPKCRKIQIPRVDISAPANSIDYHPALLAHADENNGGGGTAPSATAAPVAPAVQIIHVHQPPVPFTTKEEKLGAHLDSDSGSELSELSDDSLSDDSMEIDDDESLDYQAMSQAEQAEHECFGEEYKGPKFSEEDASRMLILMSHASNCPCNHKLTKHREVCMSTKFLMLHVRDCPGTTASFDVCPFPWCRKVKHLLYHMVSCPSPATCNICSPSPISDSLKNLTGLNKHRAKKYRQKMISFVKAKSAAPKNKNTSMDTRPSAQRVPPRKSSEGVKAAKTKTKVVDMPVTTCSVLPHPGAVKPVPPAKTESAFATQTSFAHIQPSTGDEDQVVVSSQSSYHVTNSSQLLDGAPSHPYEAIVKASPKTEMASGAPSLPIDTAHKINSNDDFSPAAMIALETAAGSVAAPSESFEAGTASADDSGAFQGSSTDKPDPNGPVLVKSEPVDHMNSPPIRESGEELPASTTPANVSCQSTQESAPPARAVPDLIANANPGNLQPSGSRIDQKEVEGNGETGGSISIQMKSHSSSGALKIAC